MRETSPTIREANHVVRNINHFTQKLSPGQYNQLMRLLSEMVQAQAGNLDVTAYSAAETGYVLRGPHMKSPEVFGEVNQSLYVLEPNEVQAKSPPIKHVAPSLKNSISSSVSKCLSESVFASVPLAIS
ncbi:uncharacterized protein LOC124892854, partial [Capsicum annuum]|uniref:uncharacterized protein LOC124892854 n=1 Tax=Capsicum annuum TaxID=4072 RepID=UPI001FB14170